ncbi:MAG TPA: hypothetical protein VFX70_03480 [Mycobacteriales bacterium]|nr:hypothetical protein [Mycobacteriales bacterium]
MTGPDPKTVIQAHVLRAAATRDALLHGTGRARSGRNVVPVLWGSLILALVIIGVVVVTGSIVNLLHKK